jgi:hypothetical protein
MRGLEIDGPFLKHCSSADRAVIDSIRRNLAIERPAPYYNPAVRADSRRSAFTTLICYGTARAKPGMASARFSTKRKENWEL